MKKTILNVMMALPVLLIGIGESLANFQVLVNSDKMIWVESDRPQPTPLILAARDEQTRKCRWLGTCPKPK